MELHLTSSKQAWTELYQYCLQVATEKLWGSRRAFHPYHPLWYLTLPLIDLSSSEKSTVSHLFGATIDSSAANYSRLHIEKLVSP